MLFFTNPLCNIVLACARCEFRVMNFNSLSNTTANGRNDLANDELIPISDFCGSTKCF